MSFIPWVRSHSRSFLFLMTALIISGIFSAFSLPVALFPEVSFPRVRVTLDAGDRPAERMAVEVTYKVEEAVRAIPGVKSIRSTTSRGTAEISINFDWGMDMISALLQVEAAISRVLPGLPPQTRFNARRMDPTVFPVIAYSMRSQERSLSDLYDLAYYQLRPALSTVSGVAKVGVQGGAVEEYHVVVDTQKMQASGFSTADVVKELAAANVQVSVGRLEDQYKLYLAVVARQFTNLAQIAATPLHGNTNGIVLLKDIADVGIGTEPQWIRVVADGQEAVLFSVYQQPNGNTVQIARGIVTALKQERSRLPPGIEINNWYDQSALILSSEHSARDAVVIGVLLAALILLIFLRNWRITLIAALAVPAALAGTVMLLRLLHMSFNIMTLGGMAAAIGLIIDDAIVMVEHISRKLRGTTKEVAAAVIEASREFTPPLAGSRRQRSLYFFRWPFSLE